MKYMMNKKITFFRVCDNTRAQAILVHGIGMLPPMQAIDVKHIVSSDFITITNGIG